jgi:hypothetical protein
MATKEPEIAPTVSFRPPSLDFRDQAIGEHKSGYLEQQVATARGKAPALLPPTPQGPAPKTSLSSRLAALLKRGG